MNWKRALSPLTIWFVLLLTLVLSWISFAQNASQQGTAKPETLSSKLPTGVGANGLPLASSQQMVLPPGARILPNASQLFHPPTMAKTDQSSGMFHPLMLPTGGNPIFASLPTYPTAGNNSISVAAADLNGDGFLDLVSADECQSNTNCANGGVSVLINNGDGTYKPAVSYPSGGLDAWSVTTGDVNGDGFPDIVVGNHCADSTCYTGNVSVLLGNGDGTFQSPVSYLNAGLYQPSVALADLNGDGHLDIAVSNQCQGSGTSSGCTSSNGVVTVLLNHGDGTFPSAVPYSSGGQDAFSIAIGNFDGKPDLMVVNYCATGTCSNAAVGILLNNGDGTFQSPASIALTGLYGRSGVIGDFNGDGKADVAVLTQCLSNNNCSNGSVNVLLGNGDGTFQSPLASVTANPNYNYGESLAAGDFNGDGKLDLVTIGNSNQSIQVLLGNGDGTFQTSSLFASVVYSRAILAADLNGDGKTDIAALYSCYNGNCATGAVTLFYGNGDGTFQTPPSYVTGGSYPVATAIADLNGDGKPDVIVSNQCASNTCANGSVSVLLGNGDGTVQTGTAYPVGGQYPWGAVVNDVNGDGIPDLIVANECAIASSCQNGSVSVLLGNGDGTFQPANTFASSGTYSLSVAVGDFNGDGKPDLVLANECPAYNSCGTGGSVSILLGNGDGTFQAAQSIATAGLYSLSVAVGDFNGDGKLDLAVADYCVDNTCQHGALAILLGNGDGTFQPAVVYPSAGRYSLSLAIGDFNGDGKLDVATGDQCLTNSCSNSNVSIFLGNGDGTFQTAVGYPIGYGLFGFQSLVVSDFNGDGSQDLAASSYYNGVTLLLGNGDGTFQAATSYFVGVSGYGLAAGDLNLDGKPDLAVASDTSPGLVTVLLNGVSGFRNATTTTLSSDINPAGGGQLVTFTATVTPGYKGTATGTVTFYDGATAIGTSSLSLAKTKSGGQQATFSTSSLALGAHSITAAYGGDTTFLPSTSAVLTETITTSTTATTLASSLNPSIYGQSVTLTANVTSSGGTPAGTVTFTDGANTLGTSALSGGQATLSINTLGAGPHSITATYSGDVGFNSSSSSPLAQTVNQATTALALVSSANPSAYSQSVTFTATITPQFGGQSTGTVTFKDGATTIGTGAVSGNAAAFTTNALALGSHSITASYGGDSNFTGSNSGTSSQVVHQATTTSAVASSANPAYINQSITFTATVTGQFGGLPTGSVSFKAGSTSLGAATLNSSGQATLTTLFSTSGSRSITAVYAGDVNYQGSTSAKLTQAVNKFPTTTTLGSSQNPSLVTQQVTFTVSVSSTYGSIPNGDKVTLKDGSTVLATLTLSGGTATYSTASLAAGAHSLTASYAGDSLFNTSTTTFKQTVNKNATSTALVSSVNPSTYGQAVTFTATVTDSIGGTPTGTITFKSGSTTLGTSSLSGGTASVTTSTLGAGVRSISAIYSGDATYLGSTAPTLTQTVSKASTTTAITSSPNPSTSGQLVTITATVTSAAGTPVGTVTFKTGSTVIGTATLNGSGVATVTTSTLPVGSDSITATYAGSTNFFSSGASTTQRVNP